MTRTNGLGVGEDDHQIARKTRMKGRDVGDRRRVRNATRFHQDLVRASISVQQAVDRAHEVVPHGAADASVRERDGVPAVRGNEVAVDVQLAEVVDEHRVAHPVAAGEDTVEQRGLARPEEPADDAHRYSSGHVPSRNRSMAGTVAHGAPPARRLRGL